MARIKITDDRQGRSFRTGVNGRFYDFPLNTEQNVDDEMLQHLKDLGVAFDEVSSKGAASKEGSDGAAPIGDHDVLMSGTVAKSLGERPLMGDQPGDLTSSGGVRFASTGAGPSIADDAAVSDIRVASERATPPDAAIADIAGEGEGGTTKTPAPKAALHKDTDAGKKSAKK